MGSDVRRPRPARGTVVGGLRGRIGRTSLLVAVHDRDGPRVLGLIHVKDVVKDGIRARFAQLRRMGIRTVMITGDHPLTARAIAEEAGVDDYLARRAPRTSSR